MFVCGRGAGEEPTEPRIRSGLVLICSPFCLFVVCCYNKKSHCQSLSRRGGEELAVP